MVTLLVGSSGLLGSALREALSDRPLRQLIRRDPDPNDAAETIRWDPRAPLPDSVFDGVTAVINLGGAGVGDRRWSPARLEEVRGSRTIPTRTLATAMAKVAHPIRYLQASAVGYYGDTGNTPTDESAAAGDTVLARICREWEAAAEPAIAAGHPTTFLRTGIVLSPDGGALGPLLRLIRLGLGGPLGSGRQWWPWIHVDDWVRAVVFLLSNDLSGPVNLTAPRPAPNRQVTKQIAAAFRRPAFVPAPAFALKIALGGFAEEILRSQRVVPRALLEAGFTYAYPEIPEAAQALTR